MKDSQEKLMLLQELIDFQKALEQKVDAQNRMIGKIQQLAQNEELFSQVISDYPWPLIVFDKDGRITMSNLLFNELTGIRAKDAQKKRLSLLNRLTTKNAEVLDAMQDVFDGNTRLLQNLDNPLSMFMEDENQNLLDYQKAMFFPASSKGNPVFRGIAVFMK